MKQRSFVFAVVCTVAILASCSTTAPAPSGEEPPPPETEPQPPWQGAALASSEAPAVLLSEWREAENREHCAPFSFASTAVAQAKPRAANFSGGWAVAWDTPSGPGSARSGEFCSDCGRGSFGIAGTGVEPSPDTYDAWDYQRTFSDGSRVGYGERSEQWLAYVQIAGERCLYNVWSYRGREHLEDLLGALRRIDH